MTIQDLIRLLANRVATLNVDKATAESRGDLERVTTLDAEIAETEVTLSALRAI
jgi:hypothetical protein